MNKSLIALAIFCLGYISCRNEPRIPLHKHDLNFARSVTLKVNPTDLPEAPINLCEVFNYGWDSLIIIPPYTEVSAIKDIDFENFSAVRPDLTNSSIQDIYSTLLFVKDNKIFKHERIPNTPISFSQLAFDTNSLPIIKVTDCKRMVIKKGQNSTNKKEYRLAFR